MTLKRGYCPPHLGGVSPGTPPFFYAGCQTCERKLKAGIVKGDEGPAVTMAVRARINAEFNEYAAKKRAMR